MKKILFLLLFPSLAFAQYQGNANQKITLGEQTTADGLVWRGRLADTANLLTNKLDTSVYIVLDTGTRAMWYYSASTTPKWTRLVDSLNNLQGQLSLTSKVTGVLPVANGGTNRIAMPAGYILHGDGTSVDTAIGLFWDRSNKFLGVGTTSPVLDITINSSSTTPGMGFAQGFKNTNAQRGGFYWLNNMNSTVASVIAQAQGDSVGTGLEFSTRPVGGANTLNMVLRENGKLGIGTPSPTAKLDVNGDIKFKNSLSGEITSSGAQIVFYNNANLPFWINMFNNNNTGRFICGIEGAANTTFTGSSANSAFFGSNAGDLHILSDGSIRQTIKSTGNIGIGTTTPLALLNVMGTVRINSASAPDANYYLQLENSSSQKAKANAWDTYSDKRIKTDIQPIVNAIDKVNLLNPVYYQKHDSYVENDFLNIDFDSSVKSLGFIAQEVYNVIPEAVNTGTTNELWAMDYTKIIPILTKAIQEQQTLIKALEQRILNLENK